MFIEKAVNIDELGFVNGYAHPRLGTSSTCTKSVYEFIPLSYHATKIPAG